MASRERTSGFEKQIFIPENNQKWLYCEDNILNAWFSYLYVLYFRSLNLKRNIISKYKAG